MLRAALLAAVAAGVTSNAYADDTKLELYSSSASTRTEDNLTVSGTDRVGYIDANGNLYTAFNNNTRTQNLTVNGDLTIEGNGHVAVGGGNADGGSAAYLKVANGTLTVKKLTDKDNPQLDALGCEIKNLDIQGGTVRLDATSTSYCGSGNSSYSASSNKQATITNSLTISGGKLYMGAYNGAYVTKGLTSYHCSAGFKGTINQTGGLMSVRTDAAFSGAVTINQTGTDEADMYFTEQMEIGSSLTINQSNDNATLGLGRLTKASAYSSVSVIVNQSGKGTIKMTQGAHFGKGSTVKVNQTGDGTIDVCDWYTTEELAEADRQNYRESVRRPYTNQNATYTLEQSGKGTINIATAATINADSTTVGNGAKLNVQGKLTTEELTLASGAKLDNTGTLTVGSGTAGATGALNVTSDGVLNVVLDGTNAALTVGASNAETSTVTSWTMAEGSTFGIGFTYDYLKDLGVSAKSGSDNKIVSFANVLVADVAAGSAVGAETALKETMGIGDVGGTDSRHWVSVGEDTELENDANGKVVLSGSLEYNPWIEITADEGSKSFSDVTDNLRTGLVIKDVEVSLSGENTYTQGTQIKDAEVTLESETALGGSPTNAPAGTVMVETSGTSSLIADVENGKANLPGAIKNTGTLTMQGAFSASNLAQTSLTEGYVDITGATTTGGDGFHRESGTVYLVVDNVDANASLIVQAGTTITIGGVDYQLYSDGYASNLIDYTTYYIQEDLTSPSAEGTKLSDLLEASGNLIATVEMGTGKLTVDKDCEIEVNATDGELVVETGTVAGSLTDTTVKASGGELAATISGASTVEITGDTTISGDNDYTGDTVIDGAEVTLNHADALGGSSLSTKKESSLSTGDGVVAVLNGTILNEGELTLSGAYKGQGLTVATSDDTRIGVDGNEGANGFLRDGETVVVVVENATGASLTLGGLTSVESNGETYYLSTSGKAGAVDYNHYLLAEADYEVSMSAINDVRTAAGAQGALEVEMQEGALIADADVDNLKATGGLVVAQGADIAGELSGSASLLVVAGDNTLSGDNTHMGDTIISGAKLELDAIEGANALGNSDVFLTKNEQTGDKGVLDLNGHTVTNNIYVTGCELHDAANYQGNLTVSGNLTICGTPATANEVTLSGAGNINPSPSGSETLTVNKLVVEAGAAHVNQLVVDTTVKESIVLYGGAVLTVAGELNLEDGTVIVLHGAYKGGDTLIKLVEDTGNISKTTGSVTLDHGYGTFALDGDTVILTGIFDQTKADAAVQGNWGIFTASRAFVNAVLGQRTNTGCIANGRGTVWAAVLGAYHDLAGSDINVKGAAMGVDWKLNERHNVGLALGYTDGEVTPKGLRELDQTGTYMAVYGEHGLRKLSDTSCLSLDWVLAYGQTESDWNGMSWEQDSLQLNARVNWNKKLSERLGMSVFGGLEYFTSDSATVGNMNTGDIQNLRAELGVGVNYVAWGMPADAKSGETMGCKTLVLHGELRYMNDLMRSNPEVTMDGLRGAGENPGRSGVGIEAGATYRINERWSTSANYSFNALQDSREHRLNVGASYSF